MNAELLRLAGNGKRLVDEYLKLDNVTMPSLSVAMDIKSLAAFILFTAQTVGYGAADIEDALGAAYMMGKRDGLDSK